MKEAIEDPNKPLQTTEHFSYKDKLEAAELNVIKNLADQESIIDHKAISELTKIILKIDPAEVDEFLQAKFNRIKNKVKAQYA